MRKLCILIACVVFVGFNSLQAQTVQISGTVTSADDGSPIPGASIQVKGTTIGTATDVDGRYSLSVPANATTIVISFVGMVTQEVVIAGRSIINAILVSDILQLEEIVVTALGIARESKSLGYAVQTLKGEDMLKGSNINPVNAISGRVAGVSITNSSGAAGASSFMTIRGNASLTGNNQPLFVIDGVPIDNSQLVSGDPRQMDNNLLYGVALSNRIVDLNPEDIESVSILRGGAATALYGLRAGNGAVIITTKKGATDLDKKATVSFSSSISFEKVSQLPKMNEKYAQGLFGNLSTSTLVWGPLLDTLRFDGGTNLYYPNGNIVGMSNPNAKQDLRVGPYDNSGNFFQTGGTYNNSLSISGGFQNTNYFLSIGNTTSNGIVPNNTFQRTTVTLAGESRLTNWFRTDARIAYANSGGVRIQQGSNTSGVMLALLRMPPNFDITGGTDDPVNSISSYMLPDGRQRNAYNGLGYDNPFWTANMNQLSDRVNRVTGHIAFDILLTDWLNINYRAGSDFYSDRRNAFIAIGSRTFPSGRVYNEEYFNMDFNSDLIINVNTKINDDFSFTGLFGHNIYQTQLDRIFAQGDVLTLREFYNISGAISVFSFDITNKKRTAALFSDLGISFRNMVYANATLRNEWSTTLPEANNSFLLYSGSGSFIFTELPVFKGNSILPFGKVRVSYAEIANDAFVYATLPSYPRSSWGDGWTDGISFPGFGGIGGFNLSSIKPNDKLKPEFTKTFEVGLDLRFINNRLGLDFTYYNSNHEDLILSVPVARSCGYGFLNLNAGSMVNRGIEIVLNSIPIKTKNFQWNFDINFTRNRNKVLDLHEGVKNVTLAGFVGAQSRAVVGEPYGSIFGDYFETKDGKLVIDDDPSSPNFGFPVYSTGEKNLGNVMPDWTTGINNSLSYKGITFSFLIDIKRGGVMWNGTKGAMYYFGTHKDTESRDDGANYIFDGVKQSDGSPNDIPIAKDFSWYVLGPGSGFTGPTSQFVEKTDWIRLREVTLSYRFDSNLLSKTFFSSAELYFSGRNLWLSTPYTGIDPETSLVGANNGQGLDYYNMPGTKSYTFGLRLTL